MGERRGVDEWGEWMGRVGWQLTEDASYAREPDRPAYLRR
jgi:hypothetical protein